MFGKIAAFELRYQIRSPAFWVTGVLFFLFAFGAAASDNIRIGSGGNVLVNSPYAIAQTMLVLCVFALFIVTAFVANVVIRDEETGFAPLIHVTRVGKFDYLFGRFTGAFVVSLLVFAFVPLGNLVGAAMPWVDPETVGPLHLGTYLYTYFVLCVPTLFVMAAGFFALATATRSMLATYLGVVGFLVLYLVTRGLLRRPEFDGLVALVDPFGLSAYSLATKYWTAAERNTLLPQLAGRLLVNRLAWGALAFALLALAWRLFDPARRSAGGQRAAVVAAQADAPPATLGPAAVPEYGARAAWAQLRLLARFDAVAALRSPGYVVLLGIGFVNAVASLWYADEFYGNTIYPVTRVLVQTLEGSFVFIPLIIAIYYAGELVWLSRERRVNEIIDATPAPDWSFVLPKVLAIALVLLSTLAVSVVAAVGVQLLKGYTELEISHYLAWYLLPNTVDLVTFAVLAVLIQALVPHKYIGWLVMLVVIIAQVSLGSLGFEHNLYQYGGSPPRQLSDMNGQGRFAAHAAWFRAYWGACAVLLTVLAHVLWRRGAAAGLGARLVAAPRRLAGPAGLIAGAAVAVMAGLGIFIYYNTNVLNEYRTARSDERYLADYEKALLRYEATPQPRITDVVLDVALYPHAPRATVRGSYQVQNRSGAPLAGVHLRWPRELAMQALSVDGATAERDYGAFNYRIFRFTTPLQPGERRAVHFQAERAQLGFRNRGDERRINDNGSFLDNSEIAPQLGMSREMLLQDRAKRRKYGLAPELRMAKLEDVAARGFNGLRHDSDFVNADITLSTEADQLPVAPGYKVSESVSGGRRTVRYRTDAPIQNFFSLQSAAYAVARDHWHDVELSVYYHPAHAYNVARMIRAMQASLDYYSVNFSPFQFRQLRILEFPDYASFAQSFANTIPYSEGIGFIQNYRDAEKIDMVTYVTAHEVAHQWWGHQLSGADLQGSAFLVESLAQYSALMVMEKLYGPEQIRKFLKFELDRYLRSRGGEVLEELPLARVEVQSYIYYQKGSLAMYLLKDQLGEAAVNRALQGFLKDFAFQGAPYPRSLDLIARLRAEATSAQQGLITDLLEKITLYDVKTTSAHARQLEGGQWETTLEVSAQKLYADGRGKETSAPMQEQLDVGLFAVEPGRKGYVSQSVLALERRQVASGAQQLVIRSAVKPAFAGVDPFNKWVDRNSDDNIAPVTFAP